MNHPTVTEGAVLKLDPAAFLADPDLLRGLEPAATPVECTEERLLFHQGDAPAGLYILFSGETTLSMSSGSGDTIMSFQASPGSLLGLPGVLGNEPYSLTATALPGARIGFISRDQFLALMRSDVLLSMKILQVLAAEVRAARIALRDR